MSRSKGVLYTLVTSVLFAGSFVAAKYSTLELQPLTTTLLRYLIALLFLTCLLPSFGKASLRVRQRDLIPLMLLGLTGVVGYHFFFFTSLHYTQVANTAIINALNPIVTGLAAAAFIGERLTISTYLGVLLAVSGALLLLIKGDVARLFGLSFNQGDLLMLGAVANWVAYSLLARILLKRYNSYTVTFYAALFGVFMLMLLVFREDFLTQISGISWRTFASVLYMGVFASGLGYLLYNLAIGEIGPTRTSGFVFSFVPIFVAALAYLFFKEPVTWSMAAGMLLIISGLNFMLGEPTSVAPSVPRQD